MRKLPDSLLISSHQDYNDLSPLAASIDNAAGGRARLRDELPALFRAAIDEVIDTPRTGRRTLADLEKTEKTYLGTKVEILLRDYLQFPKGKVLDLRINGTEVDIKNTVTGSWMIPSEAIGHPCILTALDDSMFQCHFGLIIARQEYLNTGVNKDKKAGISVDGLQNVLWLLKSHPYPVNFWSTVSEDIAEYVTNKKEAGGTMRLVRLFEKLVERPIPRHVVEGVARQRDYMKRIRWNGGARGPLWEKQIALLSGKYNRALIDALGLPACDTDELISVRITSPEQVQLLEQYGYGPPNG